MKKLLLRALAVVPILLLVTSFASANSAMQLLFDGNLITPDSVTGCGALNICVQNYTLTDGTSLTLSTNSGNGGGPPNVIALNSNALAGATGFPAGHTIEVDYAVNNYMGNGASYSHSTSTTNFGTGNTETSNIYFNGGNTLGFTGTLVDSLTLTGNGLVSLAANSSGAFSFTPSPYTLIDQIIIDLNSGLTPGATPQVTSGFTIPEPASLMLLGSGLLGLANVLRRKLAK
jgi:hypothetical protein